MQVYQVHSGRNNARPFSPFSAVLFATICIKIIFPTGTTDPFHECCRPKNNPFSCVFLGNEASNLNCQSCQYCSAPSWRTDGNYCNRMDCLKFLQRNHDGENRCVYIGVQILNRLPQKNSKAQWSKDTGEIFFLELNTTSRPSIYSAGLII